MVNSGERLLTPRDAAMLLGVETETLRTWRYRGGGPPFVRLNGPRGRCMYQLNDLRTWITSRKHISTSAEQLAGVPCRED